MDGGISFQAHDGETDCLISSTAETATLRLLTNRRWEALGRSARARVRSSLALVRSHPNANHRFHAGDPFPKDAPGERRGRFTSR